MTGVPHSRTLLAPTIGKGVGPAAHDGVVAPLQGPGKGGEDGARRSITARRPPSAAGGADDETRRAAGAQHLGVAVEDGMGQNT
jgi:hypothetical protein